MQHKSNLKTALDNLRKEVKEKENDQIEFHSKKVLLFITYINNRIKNLLRKEVSVNANIVKEYFLLNRTSSVDINKLIELDISNWKLFNVFDINTYELAFKEKLTGEMLDSSNLLNWLGVKMSMICISYIPNGDEIKPDIKKAFKELEVINKRITTYYKVHGYLKEMRLEQQNAAVYKIIPIEEIFPGNIENEICVPNGLNILHTNVYKQSTVSNKHSKEIEEYLNVYQNYKDVKKGGKDYHACSMMDIVVRSNRLDKAQEELIYHLGKIELMKIHQEQNMDIPIITLEKIKK